MNRLLFLAVYLAGWPGSAEASRAYTEKMFQRAMAKHNIAVTGSFSPSPLYVLITVKEAKSNASTVVCTTSFSLNGAISKEHNLDALEQRAGLRKTYEIAISQPGRVFRFQKPEARELVQPAYSSKMLRRARAVLKNKSVAQLKEEVALDSSPLTQLYRRDTGSKVWRSEQWKDAVAHVLLERGILVGEGHDTNLYVDQND